MLAFLSPGYRSTGGAETTQRERAGQGWASTSGWSQSWGEQAKDGPASRSGARELTHFCCCPEQATNWPNGVQQPPSPTGSYEERLRSSYELRFEALKIDVEHSTQLQLDQMRSEFSSQLALQQAQFQQQQQDFLRQVHAQQSQLIAMVNPQRPRLSLVSGVRPGSVRPA